MGPGKGTMNLSSSATYKREVKINVVRSIPIVCWTCMYVAVTTTTMVGQIRIVLEVGTLDATS